MKKTDCSLPDYTRAGGVYAQRYEGNYDKIISQAKSLANSISASPAYKDFLAAKNRLKNDEVNRVLLHELREQQFSFQYETFDEDMEKKAHFLNEIYMAVSLNPVISDYLNAEYKFSILVEEMKKIFEEVLLFDEDVRLFADESGIKN